MPFSDLTHHPSCPPGEVRARQDASGGRRADSSRDGPGGHLAHDRRGEFLAMVLHELGNSVCGIVATVEVVRESEGFRPHSEWLWTGLEDAARQVLALHADLMELCQASHPTFRLHRMPLDLAAAGRSAIDRRRPDFERLGLGLTLEIGRGETWVLADPERLRLVLDNLLDNAAKYSEPSGQVTVSVETTGDEAVLRVLDTGVGIAAEVLPFVFEPFVRERIPEARARQGSGVGLVLVRTLVELHGG
jgi:signal transduction histidine kinase